MADGNLKKMFYQVRDLLDKRYTLVYVDRESSFRNDPLLIQKTTSQGDWEGIDQGNEWFIDSQDEAMGDAFEECKSKMASVLRWNDAKIARFMEEWAEELRDEIRSRDSSNVINSLLVNTGEIVFFYDTGYYCEWDYNTRDNIPMWVEVQKIKDILGIKTTMYDPQLAVLIEQGSYRGGHLGIFFREEVKTIVELCVDGKEHFITFQNPVIGLYNCQDGAGDHMRTSDIDLKFQFNRTMLFVDAAMRYSYTDDICGMAKSWCDATAVGFIGKPGPRRKEESLPMSEMRWYLKKEK